MIFNMVGGANGGGGEAGLNFTVKPYPNYSAMIADTPKNNTIGVVTESMTEYVLSSKEPATSDGLVWIEAGAFHRIGNASLQIVKDKPVFVELIRTQIYSGGIWSFIESAIYQNGAWTRLKYIIYDGGIEYIPLNLSSGVTKRSSDLYGNNNGQYGFYTDMIDVTNINYLKMRCRATTSSGSGNGWYLGLSHSTQFRITAYDYDFYIKESIGLNTDKTVVFDCRERGGEYYLKGSQYGYNASQIGYIFSIWAE